MAAIFDEDFSFSGFERDYVALNVGPKKFLDISGVSGLDSISDGRGSVFADFDNDGDTDVFLTTVQREAHFLFRNNVGTDNRFLRVELEGRASGRDAFGATVRVKTSQGVLTKLKAGGSGYLSQHDPRLLFGLGADDAAEWVEVEWPSGESQRYERIEAGTVLRLVEGEDRYTTVAERRFSLTDPLSRSETLMAQLGLDGESAFPDIPLRTLDGQQAKLSGVVRPGSRYLVNFWATYCVPCAEEMPELQTLQPKLRARDIEVLGISVDLASADQIPAYLSAYGIRYPIYTTDEESVPRVFPRGEVLIPTSFLLDDRLQVLEVFSGWSPETSRALHALAN